MQLNEYIDQTGASNMARALDISRSTVSYWRSGQRQPGPKMARRIQVLSEGQVKAADIRPDIFGEI